jgi:rhodanese-related sulfurtransferase
VGRTIDELLAEARRALERVGPVEAHAAIEAGAVIVDIRPLEQRRREGEVPGAVVIGRTVLEWRVCPTSPDRIEGGPDYDDHVIVMCSEGFSSSLAAATLKTLGFTRATDLDGGIRAWRDAGFPVVACRGPTDEEIHGHGHT